MSESLTARDIMNAEIGTVGPRSTVRVAIDKLMDLRASGLPVIDDQRNILGIISEFSLLAVVYDGKVLEDPVEDHMTREVIWADPQEPLTEIANRFISLRLRRMPVVSDGKLLGMISRRDVLRSVLAARQAEGLQPA